jgi:hypothetical protein
MSPGTVCGGRGEKEGSVGGERGEEWRGEEKEGGERNEGERKRGGADKRRRSGGWQKKRVMNI